MEHPTRDYEAFISYRHLPLDMAVAARLQTLLENYRPPKEAGGGKRIRYIFRDRSELPTSGDLNAEIQEALLHSKYLIPVCGSKTKESEWCMEEIRRFKEYQNGRTDHILPILIEGEPDDVFPEELLHERFPQLQPDGSTVWREHSVEPLCADIRAKSTRKTLKLLKREYLRLAAPILGVPFDDLYQRHQRQRRKRLAAAAIGGLTLMTCVLAVVSVFAYRSYISEKHYRSTLAESYTRRGAEHMETHEYQEALCYFASALKLEPEIQRTARNAAAVLLESHIWPCLERTEKGRVANGTALSGADSHAHAYSPDGSVDLRVSLDKTCFVQDAQGNRAALPAELGEYLSSSPTGDVWTFLGEDAISFYYPADGSVRTLPRPTAIHSGCSLDSVTAPLPAALPAGRDRALTVYGGYVYLYQWDGGAYVQKAELDLANLFPEEAEREDLDVHGELWVSPDGSLAVVHSGFGIAALKTEDLSAVFKTYRYPYFLNSVSLSADGDRFALVFGNRFSSSSGSSGGYLEFYDQTGRLLLETPIDPELPLEGAAFHPDDPDKLLAWSATSVRFWDIAAGREYAVPLELENVEAAAYTSPEDFAVCCKDGVLRYYRFVDFECVPPEGGEEPPEAEAAAEPYLLEDAEGWSEVYQLPSGLRLAWTPTKVALLDENGGELDALRLDNIINRLLPLGPEEFCLYMHWGGAMYRLRQPSEARTLGELTKLDTRGQMLLKAYPLTDCVAAITGTDQLLVYRGEERIPWRTLQLQNHGEVRELREIGNSCLMVTLKVAENQVDSYHFSNRDVSELWDLEAGLHIADVEAGDAGILESHTLPAPDAEAVAFLEALTCYAFDESQNLRAKDPAAGPALGNWSACLRPVTEEIRTPEAAEPPAEAADLGALVDQYRAGLPEDADADSWLAAFDGVWRRLEAGTLAYMDAQLDNWFRIYTSQAESLGCLDKLSAGVESYCRIVTQRLAGGEDCYCLIDDLLLRLLGKTSRYDQTAAETFLHLADIEQANADTEAAPGPETDASFGVNEAVLARITAALYRCYGLLLSGADRDTALEPLAVLREQQNVPPDISVIYAAQEALYRGDAAAAAEAVISSVSYAQEVDGDLEGSLDMVGFILRAGYVFERRGIVSEAVYDELLRRLPLDIGLLVSEVSPEAQSMGLRLGDLITAVSGRRIGTLNHAQFLLGLSEDETLTVLRDGRTMDLEKHGPAGFGASFSISLKGGGK